MRESSGGNKLFVRKKGELKNASAADGEDERRTGHEKKWQTNDKRLKLILLTREQKSVAWNLETANHQGSTVYYVNQKQRVSFCSCKTD